ncbi:MAG: phage holin family protein [Rhodocyclaceae bacterium]|nr:phage holin family protein [Rhodocyclaceae bacterium]MBL0077175.1 phage holin family protein [Rhodocyclaceae bacterium]MBP6110244.1 phage holin family protein [Rhodocyclaceae bacterium]MBP6279347.1 phage holin family protein [Rhodocyclaceae bacterium]
MNDPLRGTPAGLFSSVRGLGVTALALLGNRLDLLGTELVEERGRLLSLVTYGAVALLLLAAGLVFLSVFITVLLWDSNRLLALGVFSGLFLAGGLLALGMTLGFARAGSKLFAASLAELRKDGDAMRPDNQNR